jgi:protein-tyrosine phosphatase/arsenate reductase
VKTLSGGTEATAFNPRAVKALQDAGVDISMADAGSGENPVYMVSYAGGQEPLRAFSKKYDTGGNPTSNFCAVMTCSQADKNCPTVAGASLRVAIPYEDPKSYDGTPQEAEMYALRSRQIAREMFYLFSQVKG